MAGSSAPAGGAGARARGVRLRRVRARARAGGRLSHGDGGRALDRPGRALSGAVRGRAAAAAGRRAMPWSGGGARQLRAVHGARAFPDPSPRPGNTRRSAAWRAPRSSCSPAASVGPRRHRAVPGRRCDAPSCSSTAIFRLTCRTPGLTIRARPSPALLARWSAAIRRCSPRYRNPTPGAALSALNDAFVADGCLIRLAAGQRCDGRCSCCSSASARTSRR